MAVVLPRFDETDFAQELSETCRQNAGQPPDAPVRSVRTQRHQRIDPCGASRSVRVEVRYSGW